MDRPDSNKSGIITPILKESVYACCGNCTDHGTTRVDFDHTASGRPAKKSGLVQFKGNFEENTEFQFPVYGFMDQTRFSDNYGFVPFVQSPGLALIIIGDEKGTAATLLLKSLAFCFPILFLSIAMLWVSSLAMWFVVSPLLLGRFDSQVRHKIRPDAKRLTYNWFFSFKPNSFQREKICTNPCFRTKAESNFQTITDSVLSITPCLVEARRVKYLHALPPPLPFSPPLPSSSL